MAGLSQHRDNETPLSTGSGATLRELVEQGISRRAALKGMLGAAGLTFFGSSLLQTLAHADDSKQTLTSLGFAEAPHTIQETQQVAGGYDAKVLIRWGDAVLPNAPTFNAQALTAEAQAQQFGYNNDFIGYLPLPKGSENSEHGLLCVNHEYVTRELVHPKPSADAAQASLEMAAHGFSIVEVKKVDGTWQVVAGSTYNRRLHASSEFSVDGPVAGHLRLQTSADPTGKQVLGTLNNCAGGVTPWGTVLTCEENVQSYFGGTCSDPAEARNHQRMGVPGATYDWHQSQPRFDLAKEPHEPNRFGWVVEIDPYNPTSTPVKHTALGRFRHEGATTWQTADGRLVVYSGDDQMFDYLYKFVSKDPYVAGMENPSRLLSEGTLFVAVFQADNTLQWVPLTFGEGPLTAASGFQSQADVLIETRTAADLSGATKLDRPEDVETSPLTGKVYVMLTNNKKRKAEQVDAVNDRAGNQWGQIVEITHPLVDGKPDHGATTAQWDLFIKAGNPAEPGHNAKYHPQIGPDSWFACPDNCAFDPQGRLWISTDGAPSQKIPDGMYACETEGDGRALPRFFYACPAGAEMCGPCFTPDGKTLFVAVQHPGEDGTYEAPLTRWPDFDPAVPPRPSVVAITKLDGGVIGSA